MRANIIALLQLSWLLVNRPPANLGKEIACCLDTFISYLGPNAEKDALQSRLSLLGTRGDLFSGHICNCVRTLADMHTTQREQELLDQVWKFAK